MNKKDTTAKKQHMVSLHVVVSSYDPILLAKFVDSNIEIVSCVRENGFINSLLRVQRCEIHGAVKLIDSYAEAEKINLIDEDGSTALRSKKKRLTTHFHGFRTFPDSA